MEGNFEEEIKSIKKQLEGYKTKVDKIEKEIGEVDVSEMSGLLDALGYLRKNPEVIKVINTIRSHGYSGKDLRLIERNIGILEWFLKPDEMKLLGEERKIKEVPERKKRDLLRMATPSYIFKLEKEINELKKKVYKSEIPREQITSYESDLRKDKEDMDALAGLVNVYTRIGDFGKANEYARKFKEAYLKSKQKESKK